jgi:hypothetical protein
MSDFTKLENIYRIFSPTQEIAAELLNSNGNANDPLSMVRRLTELLVSNNNGSFGVDALREKLDELGAAKTDIEQRNQLNRWFSFFSSSGDTTLSYQKSARAYQDPKTGKLVKDGLTFANILGIPDNSPSLKEKNMSICLSRNAFISPATRDASKVETFLNFLPPVILSQCIPYVELEFVFDRPDGTENKLSTPSLLKFLMGGTSISENESDPNTIMYKSQYGGSYKETNYYGDELIRQRTTAGMELFTSPQTLINLDPTDPNNRYVPVLDPMRPLASLESVTINIKGTTGVMSHKTAALSMTLFDKSRLSEFADVLQPASYGRSTVWLTYGWRYPDNLGDDANGTYAEFINNNMLLREAYGIVGSTYSFNQSGGVGISLELFTKHVSDVKKATIDEDLEFKKLKERQRRLSQLINNLANDLNLRNGSASDAAEVRSQVVLNAAATMTIPQMDTNKVGDAITELLNSLEKANQLAKKRGDQQIPQEKISALGSALDDYYHGGKKRPRSKVSEEEEEESSAVGDKDTNSEDEPETESKTEEVTQDNDSGEKLAIRQAFRQVADAIVKKKFDVLATTPDPFIIASSEKEKLLLQDDMGYGPDYGYPYLYLVKDFKTVLPNDQLTKIINSRIVSFGKLFSVFMGPVLLGLEGIDESQIIFYNLNEYCGLAASTNIAEFAIDLPAFLYTYRETIANNGSTTMTVEQFLQLVITSQVRDLAAVPYGFRAKTGMKDPLLTPWEKGKPTQISENMDTLFNSLALSFNRGRGPFKQPEIEILLEVTYKKRRLSTPNGVKYEEGTGDLLRAYQNSNPITSPYGKDYSRILKVHIYDRTLNPYKEATNFLRFRNSETNTFLALYEINNPYARDRVIKLKPEDVRDATESQKNPQRRLKKSIEVADNVTKMIDGGQVLRRQLIVNGTAADWNSTKAYVSRMIPTLIPGVNGSGILEVTLGSQGNAMLAAAQMISMGKGNMTQATPRGSGVGNLPLRIIPAQLSMRTVGIPIIGFTQMFFVDMNTGTSVDNVYGVSGITHTFGQGKFDTNLTFASYDSYGKYESAATLEGEIEDLASRVKELNGVQS